MSVGQCTGRRCSELEISTGELVEAVASSYEAKVVDRLRDALSTTEIDSLEIERVDRPGVASIYERRLAASREGRGPKTTGLEQFWEYLASTEGDWIYWVHFRDAAGTTWFVVVNTQGARAQALLQVHNVAISE